MGQCIELKSTQTREHPALGSLEQIHQGEALDLKLKVPIASEEAYMTWSKNIQKLKYNIQIKDYLFLPLSENLSNFSSLCSTSHMLEIVFPNYTFTLEQSIEDHQVRGQHFTELEIWYLAYVLLRYLMFLKKNKEHAIPKIQNIVISQEGNLKIIPELLLDFNSMTTQIIQLSQHSKKNHSEKTNETEFQDFPLNTVGIICLSAAQLNLMHLDCQYLLKSDEVKSLVNNCKSRYSSALVQVLEEMIQVKETAQLERLFKKVEPRLNEIKSKIESKEKFGEFESSRLKGTQKYGDNISPKHSNIRKLTEYRKQSMDLNGADNLFDKSDIIINVDLQSELSIL